MLAVVVAMALASSSSTDLIDVDDQLPELSFIERHWGEWKKPTLLEWSALGLVEGLIVVDVLQTNDCLYHRQECSEGNVLIGRNPSRLRLWGMAGGAMAATAAAFYILPPRLRWTALVLVGTVEAIECAHGFAIGMRLRL